MVTPHRFTFIKIVSNYTVTLPGFKYSHSIYLLCSSVQSPCCFTFERTIEIFTIQKSYPPQQSVTTPRIRIPVKGTFSISGYKRVPTA